LELPTLSPQYLVILDQLKSYADACSYINDREDLFVRTRQRREALHEVLAKIFEQTPQFAAELGLDPKLGFEVHKLRRAIRTTPDGRYVPQIVVALTQSREIQVAGAPERQFFRGGSTLIVDLAKPAIQYKITKRIDSETRRQRTEAFLQDVLQDPLRALLMASDRQEPFAALHSLANVDGF
jgi:hypothetical protein